MRPRGTRQPPRGGGLAGAPRPGPTPAAAPAASRGPRRSRSLRASPPSSHSFKGLSPYASGADGAPLGGEPGRGPAQSPRGEGERRIESSRGGEPEGARAGEWERERAASLGGGDPEALRAGERRGESSRRAGEGERRSPRLR